MGQDKNKQLTKLLAFVKDLYDNPDNKEFAAGIQAIVLSDLKSTQRKEEWTEQIKEIYELCLKKNLREQAEDLYKDFPVPAIASDLANLYIKMEDARRANDFDAFGRFLFLQLELIVGTITAEKDFVDIYEGIRKLKPLKKFNYQDKTYYRTDSVQKIKGEQVIKDTVDKFLFTLPESVGKPLSKMYAVDKCRVFMYVVLYGAALSSWPTEDFETLSAIYNVRNHESHSGTATSPQQKEYYDRLIADKSRNYLRFLGFLFMFIKGVCENYPLKDEVRSLAGPALVPKE